jgi:hypothetical protein
MFKLLLGKGNYIKEQILEKSVKEYLRVERTEYSGHIFDFILNYLNGKDLLISDLDLLMGQKIYWENIQIYALDAESTAADLVKKLCETHGNLFILRVSEYDNTFYIEYNLRKICSITKLVLYNKYTIDKLIEPTIISYKEDIQLKLIPALIEIINIYDFLYDPKKYTEWEEVLENINKLEILALNDIEYNLKAGKEKLTVSSSFINTKLPIKGNKKKSVERVVKVETLLEFVADTDYLIISNIDNLDKFNHSLEVLEIISKNDIKFDIESLQKFLSKYDIAIIYKEHTLYIPNEHAMTKYNIYMQYNNGKDIIKQRIMSIYNNTTYQLVNYENHISNNKSYKMVDPITVIKFIYISIWTNIAYHRISVYGDAVFEEFINNKLALLKHYKDKMSLDPSGKKNFVGIYINPLVNKKILNIQNLNKGKTNYYCYEMGAFPK